VAHYFFDATGVFLGWTPDETVLAAAAFPGSPGAQTVLAAEPPPGVDPSSISLDPGTGAITYDSTSSARSIALGALRSRANLEIFANAGALIEILVKIADGNPALSAAEQDNVDALRDTFVPLLAFVAPYDLGALHTSLLGLIGRLVALPAEDPQTIPGTIL